MNVFCGCAIAAHRIPQKIRFGSSGSLGVASNVCRSAGDFAISWHDITSTACCPAGDAAEDIAQSFNVYLGLHKRWRNKLTMQVNAVAPNDGWGCL